MLLRWTALLLLLWPGFSWAQEPIRFPVRTTTAQQAIELALQDIQRVPSSERLFTRYIWVPDEPHVRWRVVSLTLNLVSREGVIVQPLPLYGGLLVRVNLFRYASKRKDLEEWLELWENFQFDPSFSLFVTADMLDNFLANFPHLSESTLPIVSRKRVLVDCPPYRHSDGEIYSQRWDWIYQRNQTRLVDAKNVVVVRFPAEHLDSKALGELQRLTGSQAPITRYAYWMMRTLSSIKEEGLYREIYGGLYYDFSGIKKSKDKKVSDEDLFFRSLGIGSGEETAQQYLDRLESDQRSAMFKSGVTGKPRRVDWFPTGTGRPTETVNVAFVTHDIRDKDIDVSAHPILNLDRFKDAAREVIHTKKNGLNGYALFNDEGVLQDEVPPDIAVNHLIPEPFTKRLKSAIDCLDCHGKRAEGWHPIKNDVQTLFRGWKGRLDVFGDVERQNLDKSIPEVLARLGGWYTGNPEDVLRTCRDDLAKATSRATGLWPHAGDQTAIFRLSCEEISKVREEYAYTGVGAHTALQEMGFSVSEEHAVDWLRILLPPDPRMIQAGVWREDVRIMALLTGLEIPRSNWSFVQGFVQERAERTWKNMRQNRK